MQTGSPVVVMDETVPWELSDQVREAFAEAGRTLRVLVDADAEEIAQLDARLHAVSGTMDETVHRALRQLSARRNHRAELLRMLESVRDALIAAAETQQAFVEKLRAHDEGLRTSHRLEREEIATLNEELALMGTRVEELEARVTDAERERAETQELVVRLTETAGRLGTELSEVQGALDEERTRSEHNAQEHARQIKEMRAQQRSTEERLRHVKEQLEDRSRVLNQMAQLLGAAAGDDEDLSYTEDSDDAAVPAADVIRPALKVESGARLPARAILLHDEPLPTGPGDDDTAEHTSPGDVVAH
ncbi:MAG: hypothetical protein AB2A00_02480 [Myxococcota bacterium]